MLEHRRKGMSGVRPCKYCGTEVAMMATSKDHLVPVAAASVKPGEFKFDDMRHQNHLRVCAGIAKAMEQKKPANKKKGRRQAAAAKPAPGEPQKGEPTDGEPGEP